ncbi:MAG: sigma-54-dependent Fis family transcriptional regulator [Planctomycetota bacterium]|nr:MAG: sigma-54-dependent Fis family transcriptional regulator [Planctomycetota bacterium]
MTKVLAVDDDRTVLHLIGRWFEDTDTEVITATTAREALDKVREERPDVLLLDIMLPQLSGLEACKAIAETDPKLPVIFITGHGSSDMAIEAMKLGAYDYLLKPLEKDRVLDLVSRAAEIRRLMSIPVTVSPESGEGDGDTMLGQSEAMQGVFKAIGRVAPQDVTVLIQGESGTGKELVARAIYQHSDRADGPFLAINCAAIPETLLESEFFGHEKGAFTGADSRRIGKFEQCSGGTIFLDEIGDMPALLQSKILRLLQEQKFERVGGNQTIATDVRIIAATNRDLDVLVKDDKFREDLLYRLKGFLICLPPLRERRGDIRLLVEHFLARYNRSMEKNVLRIDPAVMRVLEKYDWPGNVRELESLLKQALINATGTVITGDCLPDMRCFQEGAECGDEQPEEKLPPVSSAADQLPRSDLAAYIEQRIESDSQDLYAESLDLMERYLLTRVLRETGGNQSLAAKMLGITRGSLRNKIRALQLSIDQVVTVAKVPAGSS